MKKNYKISIIVMLVALCLVAFAACNGKTKEEDYTITPFHFVSGSLQERWEAQLPYIIEAWGGEESPVGCMLSYVSYEGYPLDDEEAVYGLDTGDGFLAFEYNENAPKLTAMLLQDEFWNYKLIPDTNIYASDYFSIWNFLANDIEKVDDAYYSKDHKQLIRLDGDGASYKILNGTNKIGMCAFYENNHLTTIDIPKSVNEIGMGAFAGCEKLASITIPNGVTKLKDNTFENCASLASITIPVGVKSIDCGAFRGCSSLTSVFLDINSQLENIGSSVFEDCSSLASITIPNSVTSIGSSTFKGCSSLTSIIIPNSVTSIDSRTFEGCSGLTSITIPNSVTSIGYSAFEGCSSLTSIIIPNDVTSIGSSAFEGCSGLTSIIIPNSVTSIGSAAFNGCSGLTSITLPFVGISLNGTDKTHFGCIFGASSYDYNNDYVPSTLEEVTITGGESIASNAFYNYSGLTSITMPNSVASIGRYAFGNCSGLTSIIIPNSVTSIGSLAFWGCSGLTSIIIPNSVINISYGAFEDCSSLTICARAASKPSGWDSDWNWSNRPVVWGYDAQEATYYFVTNGGTPVNPIVTIILLTSPITKKDGYYFAGWYDNQACAGAKIIFPYAHQEKTTLYAKWTQEPVNINLSELWDARSDIFFQIWGDALGDDIEVIVFSKEEDPQSIEQLELMLDIEINECLCADFGIFPLLAFTIAGGLCDDDIDNINQTLKQTLKDLWDMEFEIEYIRCGDSNLVASNQFSFNSILENNVKQIDDAWYTNDKEALIRYVGDNISFEVPLTVTKINSFAFILNDSLKSIIVPYSVTSIGAYAFFSCTSLNSITIPNSVTSIGVSAFSDCTSLTSIIIPNSVKSISDWAFSGCSGLTSIAIPDSVTSIGSYAFEGCSSLTSITIPNSVTSIGVYAFSGCSNLTSIIIPNSVTNIGYSAFRDCSSLTIYARAASKPSGWDNDWNSSNRPVIWGYTGD